MGSLTIPNVQISADEYLRLIEASKQTQAPLEEETQETWPEAWDDTFSRWEWNATKLIGGLGLLAVSGYGLYMAGASVGAQKAAEFCEKRITHLIQTGVDLAAPSIFDSVSNVFERLKDGVTTGIALYVAKDYVPAIVFGTLLTAVQYTASAFTPTDPEKEEKGWTWTTTKVIAVTGLLALAGYGMYSAGFSSGHDTATAVCDAGVAFLKKGASLMLPGGTSSLDAPASAGALVPLSTALASTQSSALAVPGAVSSYVYQTAMDNLTTPDPSILWDHTKSYATEKYENLKFTAKVLGTGAIAFFTARPVIGALKFGARAVKFVVFRR